MTTRKMFRTSLAALMLAGTIVGGAATHEMLAMASTSEAANAKRAAHDAEKAQKMLGKHKMDKAVRYAESAVGYAPRNAEYRALLGQVYLMSGRFVSAGQALNDALALDPANGKAALNLALAQTAQGQWVTARKTLDIHSDSIAPADRGLALALAGDPAGAVTILSAAAREPSANATTRQNLALALALNGQWKEAKSVASIDVAPNEVDKRIMEWAAFARPKSASDQVASLLGVVPVADSGQPVQLALNESDTRLAAVSPVVPADAFVSGSDAVTGGAAAPAAAESNTTVAAAPAAVTPPVKLAANGPRVTFAPMREIVQPLPAGYVRADQRVAATAQKPAPVVTGKVAPAKVAASPMSLATGKYYVQLGAYDSAGVARDAWHRIIRRTDRLASLKPSGMSATVGGKQYYRLSVGGFTRDDARALCGKVRADGGRCFVRADKGDESASWVKGKGTQIAMR